MVGYQGPVSWRDNMRNSIANSLRMSGIVDQMDDFNPQVDPKYDYMVQAEAIAHKNENLRQRLAVQNLQNMQIRLQNQQTRNINNLPAVPTSAPGGNNNGVPGGPGAFQRFMQAIKMQESGGNYRAVNSDSGALGAFQIMPANILGPGGWDVSAIGRDVNRTAFLNHPRLQNRIAGSHLQDYYQKYGAAGAASAWYSGDPSLWNNRDSQGNYPSIHQYVLDILRRMRR